MIAYPTIDPVVFRIGPIAVHWYGLMYLLGFFLAWWLGVYRARHSNGAWSAEQVGDLIFYVALGVILGGRVGYVLFYNLPHFLDDPLFVFRLWEGGMSFHGGLIGVLMALLLLARKVHKSFFSIADFVAPLVPLGLAAGRIGNFINGELWGRVSTVPWAMVFPHVDGNPRHPSQLYQFCLEGVLLFFILWFYSAKPRPRTAVSAVFLIGYGLLRSFAELFREPDYQLGYFFTKLTMGQLLSLPMVLVGGIILWWAYHKHNHGHIHKVNG